jgi:hypothetical protein
MVLANLDMEIQKNDTRSLPHIVHKNQRDIHQDPNVKHEVMKLLQDNIGETLQVIGVGNDLFFKLRPQRYRK